jgi:ATP-dependent RNA helicase DDX49/DBP8
VYVQVLDEADRMLEDNFGDQLQIIFGALPEKRQTLLFSATLTESLKQLEQVAANKPFFWTEETPYVTAEIVCNYNCCVVYNSLSIFASRVLG